MLHANFRARWRGAFVGTCNLEAWSLKRFFEIDVLIRSAKVAARFEERFASLRRGVVARTTVKRAEEPCKAAAFAGISPLL